MRSLTLVVSMMVAMFPSFSSAACWKVSDLRGSSSRASEGYELKPDAFTGQRFEIVISPRFTGVKGSSQSCNSVSSTALLCVSTIDDKFTAETWSVDEVASVVIHTKAIAGYGVHDGANLFIGKVVGVCRDE